VLKAIRTMPIPSTRHASRLPCDTAIAALRKRPAKAELKEKSPRSSAARSRQPGAQQHAFDLHLPESRRKGSRRLGPVLWFQVPTSLRRTLPGHPGTVSQRRRSPICCRINRRSVSNAACQPASNTDTARLKRPPFRRGSPRHCSGDIYGRSHSYLLA
jgi:hypothetical protein